VAVASTLRIAIIRIGWLLDPIRAHVGASRSVAGG
jgi:cyanate permease